MYNRFILLYLLLLVSLSFVSNKNCEDYDFDKCGEYIYSESDDKSKKCFYDYELGKCQFKACSELSFINAIYISLIIKNIIVFISIKQSIANYKNVLI